MKREEHKAVQMLAANGVKATAVYNHEDALVSVTLEGADGKPVDIPGPLFLQGSQMVGSSGRYGGSGACADHGVHEGWDCPVCHPPKPKAVPALPEPALDAAAIAVLP